MENRLDTPDQTPHQKRAIHLDQQVLDLIHQSSFSLHSFHLVAQDDAAISMTVDQGRLRIKYADKSINDFPLFLNNILFFLQSLPTNSPTPIELGESIENISRTNTFVEKKIFSSVQLSEGQNVKDLWDEIFKKINNLSNETHSIGSLVEKLLEVPFLQHFESSLIILHLKGQTKASILGTLWKDSKYQALLQVKQFNTFYNSVKKAKLKAFSTESFPELNLPFNGSFLAKEISSKKYSLIAIASRNDFLSCSKEEIDLYGTCIDLLQPHFERLVDQEFSDKTISELRLCLKNFPLPLRIKDTIGGSSFFNDLYQNELQDKDIFFSKRTHRTFSLDLYDSDELRHYAFDLFHFQRISLLGELLNTLRHELSNPLFGLKLGAQIFSTLEIAEDNKLIMKEIEKNINRCQAIIENFSNLYQVQNETKSISIQRMIDEAVILSKSEVRGIKIEVSYDDLSKDQLLHHPLIFVVQIIFNLIVNASQAIKLHTGQGLISIRVHSNAKEICIDVMDNGPGIPEEAAVSLFKPFFTTKSQGTGLGLVLSRNLAIKMGGNLEYLVNNNQKGALFRLSLPIS